MSKIPSSRTRTLCPSRDPKLLLLPCVDLQDSEWLAVSGIR